jgi:hypothetical protein
MNLAESFSLMREILALYVAVNVTCIRIVRFSPFLLFRYEK